MTSSLKAVLQNICDSLRRLICSTVEVMMSDVTLSQLKKETDVSHENWVEMRDAFVCLQTLISISPPNQLALEFPQQTAQAIFDVLFSSTHTAVLEEASNTLYIVCKRLCKQTNKREECNQGVNGIDLVSHWLSSLLDVLSGHPSKLSRFDNSHLMRRKEQPVLFGLLSVLRCFCSVGRYENFRGTFRTLLRIMEDNSAGSVVARVNASHCVWRIFRESSLFSQISSLSVVETIKICCFGLSCSDWLIQNASISLFAAFLETFVKSGATIHWMTVNQFFKTYSNGLLEFVGNCLEFDEKDEEKQSYVEYDDGDVEMQTTFRPPTATSSDLPLYLNILLSNLSPISSSSEKYLFLARKVQNCLSHRNFRVRVLSARALPIVLHPSFMMKTLQDLLNGLFQGIHANVVHGKLLLILELLRCGKFSSNSVVNVVKCVLLDDDDEEEEEEEEEGIKLWKNCPSIMSVVFDIVGLAVDVLERRNALDDQNLLPSFSPTSDVNFLLFIYDFTSNFLQLYRQEAKVSVGFDRLKSQTTRLILKCLLLLEKQKAMISDEEDEDHQMDISVSADLSDEDLPPLDPMDLPDLETSVEYHKQGHSNRPTQTPLSLTTGGLPHPRSRGLGSPIHPRSGGLRPPLRQGGMPLRTSLQEIHLSKTLLDFIGRKDTPIRTTALLWLCDQLVFLQHPSVPPTEAVPPTTEPVPPPLRFYISLDEIHQRLADIVFGDPPIGEGVDDLTFSLSVKALNYLQDLLQHQAVLPANCFDHLFTFLNESKDPKLHKHSILLISRLLNSNNNPKLQTSFATALSTLLSRHSQSDIRRSVCDAIDISKVLISDHLNPTACVDIWISLVVLLNDVDESVRRHAIAVVCKTLCGSAEAYGCVPLYGVELICRELRRFWRVDVLLIKMVEVLFALLPGEGSFADRSSEGNVADRSDEGSFADPSGADSQHSDKSDLQSLRPANWTLELDCNVLPIVRRVCDCLKAVISLRLKHHLDNATYLTRLFNLRNERIQRGRLQLDGKSVDMFFEPAEHWQLLRGLQIISEVMDSFI